MEQGFDFNDYYKEMQAKTEIPLNYAGVDLDRATENTTIVTNNVLYHVSHIVADGTTYDGNYRLMVRVVDMSDSTGMTYRDYFARQWQSVDDIVQADVANGWEPGKTRADTLTLNNADPASGILYYIIDDTSNTLTSVTSVVITVFPKYEAITGVHTDTMRSLFPVDLTRTELSYSSRVNQNVVGQTDNWTGSGMIRPGMSLPVYMRCLYGLLGLYGGDKSKSIRWMFGSKNGMARTDSRAVVNQPAFEAWVKRITDQCAEHNIGVKVDLYDSAYSNDVTAEDATTDDYKRNKISAELKHKAYLNAVKISDWTRTDMNGRTDFTTAYVTELPKFLAKFGAGSSGLADLVARMSYADGETQNAIIPSMKDVFKAWYYDASELEDSFNDSFQTVFDGMSKVPLGWKCVGSGLRTTLYNLAGTYKQFPTTVSTTDSAGTVSYVSAAERVGIDMSYILNEMAMSSYALASNTDHITYFPRVIQRGGYQLTDPAQLAMGGFTVGYVSADEYTTCTFEVVNGSYNVASSPTIVHNCTNVERGTSTDKSIWSRNSSYRYSTTIQYCGGTVGSSDFLAQNAPADILRTRSVHAASGAEVMNELVEYYNYMLANNADSTMHSYSVTADDYVLNDTATGIKLDDIDESADAYRYTAIMVFRRYVFYTACYLNYLAENGFSKASADTMINSIALCNTLENTVYTMAINGYRLQPKLGELVDASGNTTSTVTYDVIDWEQGSSTDSITWSFIPSYEEKWTAPGDSYASVGPLCDCVEYMYGAYCEMKRKLPHRVKRYGRSAVEKTLESLDDISDDFSTLLDTVGKIRLYQMFAQESVFTNKSMVGTKGLTYMFKNAMDPGVDDPFAAYEAFAPMWTMPGRFMVPVQTFRKVKKRYKRWGRTRHRTVMVPDGVRWAEVQFIDTSVYQAYPQVSLPPGKTVAIGATATVTMDGSNYLVTFDDSLPDDVQSAESVTLYTGVAGEDTVTGEFSGLSVLSANVLYGSNAPNLGTCYVPSVRVPLPRSKRDDTKYAVTVSYDMPHLPYDSEIRKKAFIDYGPLCQDSMFGITSNGDGGYGINGEARHDGWRYFHESSGSLGDLRCGTTTYDKFDSTTGTHSTTRLCDSLGICEKVSLLLRILKAEFGADHVNLIETYRSMDDEAAMCAGGDESAFLSWHNYGLAAKIVIYSDDLSTPVGLYGDEFKRLVPIAKAFTEACHDGKIGAPCNVIWCRRLLVGPSMFDWEFLPIGVGHKDAPKFREDVLNLLDPVRERSYVDVDTAGYAKKWTKPVSGYADPYIMVKTKAYQNAEQINGKHYVSPEKIKNFVKPTDIVLYDAREYVDLIQLKMNAYGTTLVPGLDMLSWRSTNPTSCSQLIRYFAMTGNIEGAKALLGGSYHDTYNYITTMYYASDPVQYVKLMLGDRYDDARVTVDKDGDSSYISLKDGLMHVRAEDAYPDMPGSDSDRFQSAQATPDKMLHGNWIDGKFYTYDERPIQEMISTEPVVDGYVLSDGEYKPASGDAVILHSVVAAQIKKEYDAICKAFTDYKGVLMYDRFEDGPMYDMADMLENEFGLISAQDLLDWDDIETAIEKEAISDVASQGDSSADDGTGVYEKVINNAEVAGMKRAAITGEHVHVNDRRTGISLEEAYKRMTSKGVMAIDMIK